MCPKLAAIIIVLVIIWIGIAFAYGFKKGRKSVIDIVNEPPADTTVIFAQN